MSHKGHHGGAWKVAYADFVTAMMALFLVLWLVAQDQEIKQNVERAFRQPFAVGNEGPGSIIPKPNKGADETVPSERGRNVGAGNSQVEMEMLRRMIQDALTSSEQDYQEQNKPIEMEVTSEGLRISIFDRSRKPIFEPKSVSFTSYGDWVFTTLAWTIARYASFTVELEGHIETGHAPDRDRPEYTNWEISADRANAARRKLVQHGLAIEQIRKVAGYADTVPMPNREPSDESNSRVTVMLKQKQRQGT